MSDDRFKQARQNLINQGQQAQTPFNDYDDSEEATAMVDISQFQSQPIPQATPQFQPPPTFADYEDDDEGATQMVDLNSLQAGPDLHSSVSTSAGFGAAQPSFGEAPVNALQVGQETDYEASTQFVNINELSAGPPAADMGAPAVDYGAENPFEGSTQFVDLNALAQGQFDGPSMQGDASSIEQDHILNQGYQFTSESIQRFGDITLIFAQTPAGEDVVLKRVWEGSPDQIPDWLITRIQQLSQISHPRLASMNGMFTSSSGCWVQLGRPVGERLTYLIQQGTRTPGEVAKWMRQVADGLRAVHGYSILYANLTTDAIWVDEASGKITLEPFDVLTFENRGALGQFGPPELQLPPEQRAVTPATDVYSFAAVILYCLTGQVTPQALESLQKKDKLKEALREALNPDPTARTTTLDPIVKALGGAGGLDKRLLIPVVLVAMVFMVVAIMFSGGGGGEQPTTPQPLPPDVANANKPDPMAIKPRVIPPGEIQTDPRLKIETSYQLNPVKEEEGAQAQTKEPTEADLKEAEKQREIARQKFEDAPKVGRDMREQYYKRAFKALAKAVKLQGKMTTDDKALFQKFLEDKYARQIHGSYVDQISKRLKNDGITAAKMPYRSLVEMDPNAKASVFFESNKRAKVEVIKGKGKQPKKEEK